ncbi:DHA2 family efflux MFS transporter permease subunit [Gluconacetobacter entanii]|uniref:DHA2 family efflux MFS transporter permease subunit n=1 Tax=Gluconacetobacter entanii TaxID=108528 RepID=A0ABT3K2Q4_9PROT|nr:DHA2 family efflux MFS transporter permease subunit [Gluconacetobacter entanii]MCW4589693.1 DHA2 family efflux MFS transporter permease subunit [Gluconacetobacter entanii]MCW4593524.1 DHA2 family efflux MFS transporter permease subunit [Gluconacetobacter entanii]
MQDASPSSRLPAGIWKIVSVAAIGSFMSQLDATIVNVSLPDLVSTLHAPFSTVQWVVSGYLLALALTLPLNGWLVDRFGGRTIYLGCFAGFTVTSALCALAWSAPSLIAFRVLQGMAGGLLAPMAQMTIARAAGKQLPRVASAVTLPILLAPLLGPVVAGGILSVASWRWIFLLNLPFGLVALLLASMFLPDDRQECRPRRLDIAGLALLSPALIALLYGTDHMGQRTGQGLLCLAVVMGILYLRQAHRKGAHALIDLALFRAPVFSASALIMFMVNGVAFAGQMLLPVWLIHACGIPAERTGWFMAPLGVGMMCTYPLTGRLTAHFGISRLTRYGAICSGLGTLMLAVLACSGFNIFVLATALFLRGAGTGIIGIPAMSAGYASVAPAEIPMATVALNIVQRIGGPTLTTLCATLLGWRLSHATTPPAVSAAFTAAFGLLCVFHGCLLLATFRLPKGTSRRARP